MLRVETYNGGRTLRIATEGTPAIQLSPRITNEEAKAIARKYPSGTPNRRAQIVAEINALVSQRKAEARP